MARASVVRVRRSRDGAVVCERCEIPQSTFARMRGLLGRNGLEPGSGMLIDAAPSVHMFFMRFPIDVVFLDRDWTVVRIVHALKPWRVAGVRRAVAALELPAGTAAEAGLEEGEPARPRRVDSRRQQLSFRALPQLWSVQRIREHCPARSHARSRVTGQKCRLGAPGGDCFVPAAGASSVARCI
jgi:uncharacterized protein